MLILTRKSQEAVVVTRPAGFEQLVTIKVLEVRGGRVKLAFAASEEVSIFRHEVWERIRAESQEDNSEIIAPRPTRGVDLPKDAQEE